MTVNPEIWFSTLQMVSSQRRSFLYKYSVNSRHVLIVWYPFSFPICFTEIKGFRRISIWLQFFIKTLILKSIVLFIWKINFISLAIIRRINDYFIGNILCIKCIRSTVWFDDTLRVCETAEMVKIFVFQTTLVVHPLTPYLSLSKINGYLRHATLPPPTYTASQQHFLPLKHFEPLCMSSKTTTNTISLNLVGSRCLRILYRLTLSNLFKSTFNS